jgi:hypothetical protein
LTLFEVKVVPLSRPTRARNDHPCLDFNLSINDMQSLHYQDPYVLPRSLHGDPHFGLLIKPTGMNLPSFLRSISPLR